MPKYDLDALVQDPEFKSYSPEEKAEVLREAVPELNELDAQEQKKRIEQVIGPQERSWGEAGADFAKSLIPGYNITKAIREKAPSAIPMTPGGMQGEALASWLSERFGKGRNLSDLVREPGPDKTEQSMEYTRSLGEAAIWDVLNTQLAGSVLRKAAPQALLNKLGVASSKQAAVRGSAAEFLTKTAQEVKAEAEQMAKHVPAYIEALTTGDVAAKTEALKSLGLFKEGAKLNKGAIATMARAAADKLGKLELGAERHIGDAIESAIKTSPELMAATRSSEAIGAEVAAALKSGKPINEVVDSLLKSARELDLKAMKTTPPKVAAPPTFSELEKLKSGFSKAQSPEVQLGLGLEAAAKGGTVVTTPLTSSVGRMQPEALNVVEKLTAPVGIALRRWIVPESILSKEVPGAELFNLVRRQEYKSQAISTYWSEIVVNLSKKYPEARRVAIGKFLDGQEVFLSPSEKATAQELRKVFDAYAERAGLPANKRISEYFTHFFDEATGHPKDMVQITAAQAALEDMRAGKLGNIGTDILEAIQGVRMAEPAISNKAWDLFTRMNPDVASNYLDKARLMLKGLPQEAFFGPISKERLKNITPVSYDFHDVMLRYIYGVERKVVLDSVLGWWKKNSARFSDELRQYSQSYLDSFRGVMGTHEAMTTYSLNKMAEEMEKRGSTWAAGAYRFLVPRKFSAELRKWQFNAKIAGNLATPLVNLSQTAINTATEAGFLNTLSAVKTYLTGGKAVQDLLLKNGIKYQANMGDVPGAVYGKISNVMSFLFRQSEEFNRGVAFIAGYQKAKAAGHVEELAVQLGQKLVDDTQFIFSRSNIPLAMTNPGAALLFQFKLYLFNQLRWMTKVSKNAANDPAKFGRMIVSTGMVGGVNALTLGVVSNAMISQLHEKELPDWIERTILFGVPGLAKLNVSESVGMRVAPEVPWTADDIQRSIRTAFGPTLGAAADFFASGIIAEMFSLVMGEKDQIDPDVLRQFYKLVIRNLPFGVGAERVADLGEEYTGIRQRLMYEESPYEKGLRAIVGTRTTPIALQMAQARLGSDIEQLAQGRKKLAEEELLNNLPDLEAGRLNLSDLLEKHGLDPADFNWKGIDSKYIQRDMPLLARKFMYEWSQTTREKIRREHPRLYMEIIAQLQRTGERIGERANPQ